MSQEIRNLIKRMATENKWGATRIHGELLKLGFDVSERSVSNYLKKLFPYPENRLKQWRTFLRNEAVAAMDYIVVPTASMGVYLYALVIIGHGRREVIHVNVTKYPTAAWVKQLLREAFPGDAPLPKYLIHDRDTSFCSREVQATIKAMGIKPCKTAFRCPWHHGIVERFNGTLRRELLAHVIIFGERHLLRLLREYIVYYNNHRTHLTRNKDSPLSRPVLARPSTDAAIVAIPHVGGLHHHYEWRHDSGTGEDSFQAAA